MNTLCDCIWVVGICQFDGRYQPGSVHLDGDAILTLTQVVDEGILCSTLYKRTIYTNMEIERYFGKGTLFFEGRWWRLDKYLDWRLEWALSKTGDFGRDYNGTKKCFLCREEESGAGSLKKEVVFAGRRVAFDGRTLLTIGFVGWSNHNFFVDFVCISGNVQWLDKGGIISI